DLGSEDREGNQDSTVSVFIRDGAGAVRHFYSAHPSMAEDITERGLDLLCPVYNVLDLTPQGRGDWYAELGYGTSVHAAPRRLRRRQMARFLKSLSSLLSFSHKQRFDRD